MNPLAFQVDSVNSAESVPALSPQDLVARTPARHRRRPILPGFWLTLGFTLFYLSVLVVIPLIALFCKTMAPSDDFPSVTEAARHAWMTVTSPRAFASYEVSFGLSLLAGLVNGVFGLIAAWTLVRYQFPGRSLLDALVDLPFAMPTAVAGIALTTLFNAKGSGLGGWIYTLTGLKIAYSSSGILVALVFIGFPFVVRTLQPVLRELSVEVEEAAACLGASRWQTARRVIFPALFPALLTGTMLAVGRAVGEYGSVTFISGNLPFRTEITPHLILVSLDEYDYSGAASLGAVMLLFSFILVAVTNWIQHALANRYSRTSGAEKRK